LLPAGSCRQGAFFIVRLLRPGNPAHHRSGVEENAADACHYRLGEAGTFPLPAGGRGLAKEPPLALGVSGEDFLLDGTGGNPMAMRKKAILSVLVIMAAGFAGWLCFRPTGQYVFLITIDTLRADHLGCYGYPRNTSPFIDSLARRGVLFEKAISQSASTCPSHASIFTGLYPSQHRVLANGFVLDDSTTTLAEILQKQGFITAAFTSTDRHFYRSHLHKGFTFYDEPQDTDLTYNLHYRPAAQTIGDVALWLANFDRRKDLFLWIHLFDPHAPFRRPKSIYRLLDVKEQRESFRKYLEKFRVNLEIFQNNPQQFYEYITDYDAEIRYVDLELRRLFRLIDSKGMLEKSLWIITADHGESLGQHNWLRHGTFLYQEDIHVPLIFFNCGAAAPLPRRVDDVVENFDIFPTLLDLLKITPDQKVKQGMPAVSLLPQLLGDRQAVRKDFAFSERQHYITRPSFAPGTPFWRIPWEDGEKYVIQNQCWKYTYRTRLEDELYDLETDPQESINLISRSQAVPAYPWLFDKTKRLLRQFQEYFQKKVRLADKNTLKRLESMGYL
jgi:choline-sulfatase